MAERAPLEKKTQRRKRDGGAIERGFRRGLSAVTAFWRRLTRDLRTNYRPERHYMRGPGPKWHERHWHERNSGSSA